MKRPVVLLGAIASGMVVALVAAATLVLSAGCELKATTAQSSPADAPDYAVTKLFVKDGVTVYRFDDLGYQHYFAVAGQSVTVTTDKSAPIGKGSEVKHEEIPTVTK